MGKALIKLFCLSIILGISWNTFAQTIVGSRHDLSVTGFGPIKATTQTEICKFCHTPHNASVRTPLWNRTVGAGPYTLYASSTLNAILGQPDGASILCLSCHDGTIAMGTVIRGPAAITMTGTVIPAGKNRLETDLSNDHPISFTYDAALATADGQLRQPNAITAPVKLSSAKVQCTACHDPHKNLAGGASFLVTTSRTSALCLSCHTRTSWATSSHSTSIKTWNGTLPDPWVNTPYLNVTENACENCHSPHNSTIGARRLLKYIAEESNCLECHSGTVATATKNIRVEFAKSTTSGHRMNLNAGVHLPNEVRAGTVEHVECADCHNPHASNNATAVAPAIKGNQRGVSGINQAGAIVTNAAFAYEICYKCHAGNTWSPIGPATVRLINTTNVRLEFATTNPSFHPVVGANPVTLAPGNFVNLGGLPSMNTSTVLYCTACHASNSMASPAGPHGSTNPQLLKLRYDKADGGSQGTGTPFSSAGYALCFSCHNETTIMGDTNSFAEHSYHIGNAVNTPCNTCHDPHGVAGGTVANNSSLINFRSSVVTPSPGNGAARWEDTNPGGRGGRCWLTCHGQDHNPK